MKGLKFTTGGLMGLVALFAVDFGVVPGITRVANPLARIGLFGALPMVHGLAFYLVLLGARLRRQGEIGLPGGVFLLVGGVGVLVLGLIASAAPQVLHFYVDNTAGVWTRPGQTVSEYLSVRNERDRSASCAAGVCDHYATACYPGAARVAAAARGYRLRLEKSDDRGGTP